MSDKSGLESFGLFALVTAAVAIGMIFNGWVLTILWGWFIVPIFGLPQLSIAYAIGLVLVVYMLVPSKTKSDKKKAKMDDIIELFMVAMGTPLVFLGIGWIVHLFV